MNNNSQILISSVETLINKIKKIDFHGLYVQEVFKIEEELAKIQNISTEIDKTLSK